MCADARARGYPAAIAPFAATIDMEPASFQSPLALVGAHDRIAPFTTEEVEPPSAFSVMRRDSVDQMGLADAEACVVRPGATIVALGVADVPEMLTLVSEMARQLAARDFLSIRSHWVRLGQSLGKSAWPLLVLQAEIVNAIDAETDTSLSEAKLDINLAALRRERGPL